MLAIVIVGLLVTYADQYRTENEAILQKQQNLLNQARQKFQSSGLEKETITQYLPIYNDLLASGFVGEEQRIEWIETGLQDLKRVIAEKGIQSIAIPPLGCGLGGLAWTEVRSRIVEALYDLDGLRVIVFEPALKESQIWLDESAKYTERFKG